MNNPTDKIIPLPFVSPFVLDLQYGDIRTHSGKTLKKSKKILKKKKNTMCLLILSWKMKILHMYHAKMYSHHLLEMIMTMEAFYMIY